MTLQLLPSDGLTLVIGPMFFPLPLTSSVDIIRAVPRNMDIYPNCPRRPPNSAEDGSRAGIAPAGGGGITGRAVLARAGAAGDRVVEQPGLLRVACATRSLRETIAHKLHTCPLRFFASSCGVTWS